MQSAALFLKMGKWLWHFPQPRFLPRLGLWECPCCAGLLSQQTPHFPRVHFCFLGSSKLSNRFSRQNVWRVTLTRNPFYPDRDIEVTFHLENDADHSVTVVVCRPNLEEGSSHCFAVSEQHYSTSFDQLFPNFNGCKYCHHFQFLDDSLLTFGHYLIQRPCVHLHTEERFIVFSESQKTAYHISTYSATQDIGKREEVK